MSVVRVTKADVIQALKTETHFVGGLWVALPADVDVLVEGGEVDSAFLDEDDCFVAPGSATTPLQSEDCHVCAVGAVLRRVLDPYTDGNRVFHAINRAATSRFGYRVTPSERDTEEKIFDRITAFVADKHYLAALSLQYEWLAAKQIGKDYFEDDYAHAVDVDAPVDTRIGALSIREALITFVEDRFPEQLDIDIDARPAESALVITRTPEDDDE